MSDHDPLCWHRSEAHVLATCDCAAIRVARADERERIARAIETNGGVGTSAHRCSDRTGGGLMRWNPKMLRERLCQQQTWAPDDFTRNEIGRLIAVLDLHRPLGDDGKHGDLHTPTCGCRP